MGSLWQPGARPGTGTDRGDPDRRAVLAAHHGHRRPPLDPPGRLACPRNAGAVRLDAALLRPGVRGCRGNGERRISRGLRIRPARGSISRPSRPKGSRCRTWKIPSIGSSSIEDRPEPMATGPYPAEGSLRVENAVELDLESDNPGLKRIRPLVFNHAHPRMILAPVGHAADTANLWRSRTRAPRARCDSQMPELAFHARVRSRKQELRFPAAPGSDRGSARRAACGSRAIVWCSSTGSLRASAAA